MTQPIDLLSGDYVATCSFCKWVAKLRLNLSMKLAIGDSVYHDDNNPNMGKCGRCKRYSMKITTTPEQTTTELDRGFWKVPTE